MEGCEPEIEKLDNLKSGASDLQCRTDLEMERTTFEWTIHKFSDLQQMAKDKVLPLGKSGTQVWTPCQGRMAENRWWISIAPHSMDDKVAALIWLNTNRPLTGFVVFGILFVAENSDGKEILCTKQQIQFREFLKDSSMSFHKIELSRKTLLSCINSDDRLNIKCIFEGFSFGNGENPSPGISSSQPSQTLSTPLNIRLSRQAKISYVTDLEFHLLSFLWKIPNFSSLQNFAGMLPPAGLEVISPKYSYCDGMIDNREVGFFGQKSPDQALWWLQLSFSNKENLKEHVCLELHTDLEEGVLQFSFFAETSDGGESTKSRCERFLKVSEKIIFHFLHPDKVSKCLESDDTLNMRCSIKIFGRLLTTEEEVDSESSVLCGDENTKPENLNN